MCHTPTQTDRQMDRQRAAPTLARSVTGRWEGAVGKKQEQWEHSTAGVLKTWFQKFALLVKVTEKELWLRQVAPLPLMSQVS